MTDKTGISIITNFGCDNSCSYCIWKNHRLKDEKQPTDWESLYLFLEQNQEKGWVSVSGGGDPLYQRKKHQYWWDVLLSITEYLKLKVSVHTRSHCCDLSFWKRVDKCVFSIDHLSELSYIDWLWEETKVLFQIRLVHVVQATTSDDFIYELYDACYPRGFGVTLKEMVGCSDSGRYQQLKNSNIRTVCPSLFFLDQGDYNIYYMPDNRIYHKFLL